MLGPPKLPERGLLLVLEGPDEVGKTALAHGLADE